MKLPAHRAGLPGNVDMIIRSAFLPAPAYRQEGGASSRLARDLRQGDNQLRLRPNQSHPKIGEAQLTQHCYLCRGIISSEVVNGISVKIAHDKLMALSICSKCQETYLSLGVALVNPENDSAIVLMDEAYSALFSEPIPKQRIIHVKEELLEEVHALFRDFKEYENRLALGKTPLEN